MKHVGMILLGSWLVAQGLIRLLDLSFRGMNDIMAVIALVAGILIILRH